MNNSGQIIIAGAGMAGTVLAAELLLQGHRVLLVDMPAANAASQVAAGLFNPITGRHMTLTWKAAELLRDLNAFLARPELQFLHAFVHWKPIYFPFRSIQGLNDWSMDDPVKQQIVKIVDQPRLPGVLNNPLGGIEISGCGWMDTAGFCGALRTWVDQHPSGGWAKERLDWHSVDFGGGVAMIGGAEVLFSAIISCEGVGVLQNPWFQGLPVRPLKGQLLELEIADPEIDYVVTGGGFILPLGGKRYLAGSTYEHTFTDENPTEAGRSHILENLEGTVELHYSVLSQKAGIRPTTPDRRPIVGTHPNQPKLHIINGLGTKGVLHAPWCARRMAEKFSGNAYKTEKEWTLERYNSKLRNLKGA